MKEIITIFHFLNFTLFIELTCFWADEKFTFTLCPLLLQPLGSVQFKLLGITKALLEGDVGLRPWVIFDIRVC